MALDPMGGLERPQPQNDYALSDAVLIDKLEFVRPLTTRIPELIDTIESLDLQYAHQYRHVGEAVAALKILQTILER